MNLCFGTDLLSFNIFCLCFEGVRNFIKIKGYISQGTLRWKLMVYNP